MPSRHPRAAAMLFAALPLLGGCAASRAPEAPAPPAAASAGPQPASPAPATEALPSPLTIQACIAYAWRHNRSLARAAWQVRAAASAVALADAGAHPTLVANGLALDRSNDPGAILGGFSYVTGDRAVLASDVDLVLPLFNAGDPPGRRDAAGHALGAARADASRSRAEVELQVTEACIRLQQGGALVRLMAESVRLLSEQARIAGDLSAQGLALPSDALAGRVRAAQREQDRLRAANDLALAHARLARLLGVDLDTRLELADEPPAGAAAVPAMDDEGALVARALAGRSDLAAAHERILEAEDQVRAAGAERLPQLRALGGYHYNSDSYLLNHQWFSAGVELSLPIYDGGVASAHVAAARAAAGARREEAGELGDEIHEQVRGVVLALREAAARVPVAAQAAALAQERLAQVRDQYAHGLSDMTTVLAAEDERVRAELNQIQAGADSRFAAARLGYVLGEAPR